METEAQADARRKRRRKNPYVIAWTITTETGAQADARWKRRRKERIVPFSSVELTSETLNVEPVLMEAQAGAEGWAVSVSASVAGVNQALIKSSSKY